MRARGSIENAGPIGYGTLVADSDGVAIAVFYSADLNPNRDADIALFEAAPELLETLIQARREYGAFGSLSGQTLIEIDKAIRKGGA